MTAEEYDARLSEDEPILYIRISRKYDVTFDAKGGKFDDGSSTQKLGAAVDAYAYLVAEDVETPTRSGYSFQGWSLDAEGESPLPDDYRITGDTTLYAAWQKKSGSGGVGGSGGGVSYKLTLADAVNGEIAFTGAGYKEQKTIYVQAGTAIPMKVTPADNCKIEKVSYVTAKNTTPVELLPGADGLYTLTMPDAETTVTATFVPLQNTDPLAAFTDLDPKAWYADDVRWVLAEGVMNGMGGGIFAPDGSVSRAMVAQVLWNLEGKPVVNYAMQFTDVAQGAWYAEAVRWAASAGLANGYEDGSFRPDGAVTREELATFLYRYLQSKGLGFTGAWMFLLEFDDASEISEWADEAMHWMVMNGILNGRGENLLVPGGTATRAELAAMLHRLNAILLA